MKKQADEDDYLINIERRELNCLQFLFRDQCARNLFKFFSVNFFQVL